MKNILQNSERPILITGPCSAESRDQLFQTAKQLKESGSVDLFRAGVWKPRTRPDSFEGVGKDGLIWLREIKTALSIPVAVEVANASHVNDALKFGVDVLWIGARTSANPFAMQEIADSLAGVDTVVLIKNPMSPDLELWTGAIERVMRAGVLQVAAIHRGFYTFGKSTYRNPPLWQIPIDLKKRFSNLPLICDPSHMGGSSLFLKELSQKAMDLNYDGLMIESHIDPSSALSDKQQQITPVELRSLIDGLVLRDKEAVTQNGVLGELRTFIDLCDDQLLDVLEKRMELARKIGTYKKENNLIILQNSRWDEIINRVITKGEQRGISPGCVHEVFRSIHQESINHQNNVMNSH